MTTRNKTPLVIAIVIIIAAIVAIAAVLATGGDDDEAAPGATDDGASGSVIDDGQTGETDGATATTNALPDELVGEIRPVTVEGTALPVLPESGDDSAVGLTAPVLIGESFDGSVVTTASDGGPVMVVFLAHWCPHCNNEIPRLLELDEAGRFPVDLKIVGVSTGVSAQSPNFPPSEWTVKMGWTWPMMADGLDSAMQSFVGAEAFGVNAFPFVAVVGADGTVLARWTGESEPDDFIAKLDAALAT